MNISILGSKHILLESESHRRIRIMNLLHAARQAGTQVLQRCKCSPFEELPLELRGAVAAGKAAIC